MVLRSHLGMRLQGEAGGPEGAGVGHVGCDGCIAAAEFSAQLALTQGEVGEASDPSSNLTVALRPEVEGRPDSSDQQELVPASSSGRVEDLLMQVLEDNTLLRVRLDQG